jgi:hypothetical protein
MQNIDKYSVRFCKIVFLDFPLAFPLVKLLWGSIQQFDTTQENLGLWLLISGFGPQNLLSCCIPPVDGPDGEKSTVNLLTPVEISSGSSSQIGIR